MNVPTTAPEVPVLPLVPSHEETLLREAVSRHLRGLRPRVHARAGASAGEPPTRALGGARRARLPRRQPPRGVRRRRARDDGAGRGGGGDRGGRLPAAAPARLAGDRRQHPRPARHARPEGALAAGHRPRAPRRSRSRSPSPTPARTPTTSPPRASAANGALRAPRAEDLHLRRRGRDALLVVARTRQRTRTASRGLPLAVHRRRRTLRVSSASTIPTALRGADKQWTLFFDDVEVGPTG